MCDCNCTGRLVNLDKGYEVINPNDEDQINRFVDAITKTKTSLQESSDLIEVLSKKEDLRHYAFYGTGKARKKATNYTPKKKKRK